ncbi:hypothetical protein M8J77_017627 [Diaphorina citri]|nr:hypothetical protein M8J77_017627 [Diaphorina citri]
MNNITSNARKLLGQQQQQPSMLGYSGLMSTTAMGGVSRGEVTELFQNVYGNIPEEMKRFLEISQDFICMGSPMLANAYVSKCLDYLEKARGALIQNMSVAGSVVNQDTRSSVVQPWLNRNQTFMNMTGAPSQVGSSVSSFKRPLPARPPTVKRKKLMPIHENHAPDPPSLAPPTFRRPTNHVAENNLWGGATSSDSDVPSRDFASRRKMVRSTPIRPDVDRRFAEENDENVFDSISPLRARKPRARAAPMTARNGSTVPGEQPGMVGQGNLAREEALPGGEDLLTKNSPSARSNTKKRVVKTITVKKRKPAPPVEQSSGDALNTTVTKHGRISKPPKKFSFMEDNSILQDGKVARKPYVPNATSTVTKAEPKKRKLLPTVDDENMEMSVQRKIKHPALSSTPAAPSHSVPKTTSTAKRALSAQNRSTSNSSQPSTSSKSKPQPPAAKKQPTPIEKPSSKSDGKSTAAKSEGKTATKCEGKIPSGKTAAKPLLASPKRAAPIKITSSGTPQIDFDVSTHSFRSCADDSDGSDF